MILVRICGDLELETMEQLLFKFVSSKDGIKSVGYYLKIVVRGSAGLL
jgi:hypothetical protein